MPRAKKKENEDELRGQIDKAKSLNTVVLETVKLWKRHHLSYDQTKHVVEGGLNLASVLPDATTLKPPLQPFRSSALR